MKTVIEMAREAGFNKNELAYLGDNFTRLAELVRADEREAIETLVESLFDDPDDAVLKFIVDAIRART